MTRRETRDLVSLPLDAIVFDEGGSNIRRASVRCGLDTSHINLVPPQKSDDGELPSIADGELAQARS